MTVLAERPALPASPPTEAAGSVDRGERTLVRLLTLCLAINIFGMRFGLALSTSGVPVLLPVVYCVVAYLRIRGELVLNVWRTFLYLMAMTVCTLAALLAFGRGASDASLTSLILLLAMYAPFCYGLPPDRLYLFDRILGRFVTMTTVLAWLSIAQFGLQLIGLPYSDVLGSLVPSSFLLHNFNTSYVVQYGSSLYKSNGFVALEPSFCSQFLALGLVAHIVRGANWRRVAVYLLAILATVSGTGLLLLAAAMIVLSVRRGPKFAATVLMFIGLAVVVVSFTPAAAPFEKRLTETSSSNSSGSLRFVQPYDRMWAGMGKDPTTVLFGSGPGFADRDAVAFLDVTGLPLNYALLPKVVLEYGVLGCAAFLAFLIPSFVRGSPSAELSGAVLVFVTVLSGSLLAPDVMYTPLVLLAWFARDPEAGVPRPTPFTPA
jgi:hypothetical protein